MADAANEARQDQRTARLQVAGARQEESGHGLARISRHVMAQLGLAEGDVIEIVGKRATAARVIQPYPEDEGLELIRLDGLQRANADVGSGEHVEVRKLESRPAQRVVFAPAQKDLRLQGPALALKRNFAGRPLVTGDLVATAGQQQISRADMPPQLRQMLNAPAFALTQIRLTVVSTSPKGVVHIDENTEGLLRPAYEGPRSGRA
ncbi:MAG: AAA family ATPase, partial [Novosphingobium meiothermophilum]